MCNIWHMCLLHICNICNILFICDTKGNTWSWQISIYTIYAIFIYVTDLYLFKSPIPYHLWQTYILYIYDTKGNTWLWKIYIYLYHLCHQLLLMVFSSLQVPCGVRCQLPTSPLHLLLSGRKRNECSINSSVLFFKLKVWVLLVWF